MTCRQATNSTVSTYPNFNYLNYEKIPPRIDQCRRRSGFHFSVSPRRNYLHYASLDRRNDYQKDYRHVDIIEEEDRYRLQLILFFEHKEIFRFTYSVEKVGRIFVFHAVAFSDRNGFAIRRLVG
jgi:hypothetical protein